MPDARRAPRWSRRVRRTAVAAPLLLAACVTWRPAGVGAADLGRIRPRAAVRVLRTDGATFTLTRVHLAPGDSLAGELVPVGGVAARRVTVPLAQVQRLETRGVDPARTAGAVLGGAALSVLLAFGALVAVFLLGSYD